MRKVLASIGVGSATVDTVLPSSSVTPGETVAAEVLINGGSVEQEVDSIEFELETRYRTEDGTREATVDRFRVAENLAIQPDREETRDVDVSIPYHTPVTLGRVDVWVETELDVPRAVDPEDKDYLEVTPTPRLQAVFDAMEELGFSLHGAECQANPYGRYASGRSFVQEFEFRPRSGQFRGSLDEVELVARPGPDELSVFVEVDRRGGLLSEVAETDESRDALSVTSTDPGSVVGDLRAVLERHA